MATDTPATPAEPVTVIEMRCRKCGAEYGVDYSAVTRVHGWEAWLQIHSAIHESCPKAQPGRMSLADVVTIPELPVELQPMAILPVPT